MIYRYTNALKRLLRQLDPICDKYKTLKLFFLIDAAYCYVRHGSSPRDYINYQFYKLKNNEKKKFITMRGTKKIEKIFNDPKNAECFNNKFKFNENFKKFVKRKWIYAPVKTDKEIIQFINSTDKVIVKPIDLSSGRGVYKLDVNKIKDVEKFCREVKESKSLIEEFILQHEEINKLNITSVNTIRIYTIIDNLGKCNIIYAALRVGGGNASVDNFHNGGVGYVLDIKTGVVKKQGINIDGEEYIRHPSSGILMLGYQIPNWNELIIFVSDAAKVFPKSRYIGWDVAITRDGFEMIEGNYMADPGFLQALDKEGKMDIFKRMA